MIFSILIVLFAVVGLLVLHEFGHFLLAKKFGVKVEEFGVFLPPRIWSKKVGETIYSLNLLPFGAFVKLAGEEKRVKQPWSFSQKPIWQRMLIVLGGVASFWLIAFLILTLVSGIWGLPKAVSDDFKPENLKGGIEIVEEPQIQIVGVSENSPAKKAGLQVGDVIYEFKVQSSKFQIKKIEKLQELAFSHKGEKVVLGIKRGKETLEISLVPREFPPEEEGPIGIILAKIVKLRYPWFRAPLQGALLTYQETVQIPIILGNVFYRFLKGEKPKGVKFVGPIGIGNLMVQALERGLDNFLILIGMISIWLALFNLFPIPALDGGKLLFLAVEGVRKKPVSQEFEERITTFFFFAFILLMIFITIKDIKNLLF
ncbi:MAG: hypothetical protein DRH33_04005 [Candidatus Nealsonbacteria bacterium]|nr:MAG: hypothetical protein DRH33_04005 [Candidatus Nealsonbacteria bacterium]